MSEEKRALGGKVCKENSQKQRPGDASVLEMRGDSKGLSSKLTVTPNLKEAGNQAPCVWGLGWVF